MVLIMHIWLKTPFKKLKFNIKLGFLAIQVHDPR